MILKQYGPHWKLKRTPENAHSKKKIGQSYSPVRQTDGIPKSKKFTPISCWPLQLPLNAEADR